MTAASLDPSTNDLVTITVTGTESGVRVTVVGEVDSSSAPQLRAQLEAALGRGVAEVSVDLAGVTFLDSAGLCVLAAAHRRAGLLSVRLRVLAAGRAVVRPLQITGLWELLGAEQVEPGAGTTA